MNTVFFRISILRVTARQRGAELLRKGMAMANVTITSPFWNRYRESVAREVIPYQWQIINDERRI